MSPSNESRSSAKSGGSWPPATWIAFSSAIIALCALGLAIYQGHLQREFLKLSFKPHMTVSFFYNEDGAGFMFGGTGVGPATLKTFGVSVDGMPQPNWLAMCRALGFSSPPHFDFTVPRPETVFKPDSYEKVFWIPSGPDSEELKLKAGRIQIRACYCSVFNDCWTVDTSNPIPQPVHKCAKQAVEFGAPPRPVRVR